MPDVENQVDVDQSIELVTKFTSLIYTRGLRDGSIAAVIGIVIGGTVTIVGYSFIKRKKAKKEPKN